MNILFLLFTSMIMFVVVGANHAALDPKAYWNKVLPFTSIPSAIQQLLDGVYVDEKPSKFSGVRTGPTKINPTNQIRPFGNNAVSDVDFNSRRGALFFLRDDLRPGKHFTFQLVGSDATTSSFVPRKVADTIPFSTADFPAILARVSVAAASDEAAAMKMTLQDCGKTPAAGETSQCATSLEAMIDFVTTVLDNSDVAAVSTEGGDADRRRYRVVNVRRVAVAGWNDQVVCHPMAYAYAVFFCHAVTDVDIYRVDLTAEDGNVTSAKAIAICHNDTEMWDPNNLMFEVLGVGPGMEGVCHFLPPEHVVWVARTANIANAAKTVNAATVNTVTVATTASTATA